MPRLGAKGLPHPKQRRLRGQAGASALDRGGDPRVRPPLPRSLTRQARQVSCPARPSSTGRKGTADLTALTLGRDAGGTGTQAGAESGRRTRGAGLSDPGSSSRLRAEQNAPSGHPDPSPARTTTLQTRAHLDTRRSGRFQNLPRRRPGALGSALVRGSARLSLRHVPTSRPPGPPGPGSEPLELSGRPEPPATRCTYAVHASLRRVGPARGATPPSQPAPAHCGPTTSTSITTGTWQEAGVTKNGN